MESYPTQPSRALVDASDVYQLAMRKGDHEVKFRVDESGKLLKWIAATLVIAALAGSANAQPVPIILAPLDIATVATGGAAVTAVAHYNRLKGGWLQNPSTATTSLCINEMDAAAATTTPGGNVACIVPGQTYILAPSGNSVSVVSSDSAHAFSGYAWR